MRTFTCRSTFLFAYRGAGTVEPEEQDHVGRAGIVLWEGAGAGGLGLSQKGEGSTEGHKEKREERVSQKKARRVIGPSSKSSKSKVCVYICTRTGRLKKFNL